MTEYILWIVLGIIALVIFWLIITYNNLVHGRNRVDESWSDIEVQLKRRYDLIPNIVKTVKAFAKHEEDVFKKVTEARAAAMGAKSRTDHAKAENMLSESLKSLFAVAEAYPALQSTGNFMHLQQELTDAEDKISSSRRFYNSQVRGFNSNIQSFPTNMIAGSFGFQKYEFFDAPDVAMDHPGVNL
ncbi:MAG: LemA family protein [Patescibacteria group bacterium]